jgi:hypothetical protein
MTDELSDLSSIDQSSALGALAVAMIGQFGDCALEIAQHQMDLAIDDALVAWSAIGAHIRCIGD